MTDPTLDPAGSIYHIPNLTVEKTLDPARVDIGKIDIVLLSHDQHYDNFDNAGRLLVKKVAKTYTTLSGAERLKGGSVGLAPWQSDTVVIPDGTEIIITATPARHGPAGIKWLFPMQPSSPCMMKVGSITPRMKKILKSLTRF